jgi:hypothetical protein
VQPFNVGQASIGVLTLYNSGNPALIIQPNATEPNTTAMIQALKSVSDGSGVVFQTSYVGTITVGVNNLGLVNNEPTGASFGASWRTWDNGGNGQSLSMRGTTISVKNNANTTELVIDPSNIQITFGSSGNAAIAYNGGSGKLQLGDPTLNSGNGTLAYAQWFPGIFYAAGGTALPSCTGGLKGTVAIVSDATAPTYNGAYTSGGAVPALVLCNGSNWTTH